MKNTKQVKTEIEAIKANVQILRLSLKSVAAVEKKKIKRLISIKNKEIKDLEECLKVIESSISEQVIETQICRITSLLAKYRSCLTQLKETAFNQGWLNSKEYKKHVADLKKDFQEPKLNRQLKLAQYMLS